MKVAKLLTGAMLATAVAVPAAALPTEAQTPPAANFVAVMIDDLDEIVMPYWDAMPATAARMRDQGVYFDHAIASTTNRCPQDAPPLTIACRAADTAALAIGLGAEAPLCRLLLLL